MWPIRKILVPTDFSKPSEASFDAAIELAKRCDASIVLMHAYQVPVSTYPMTSLVTPEELARDVEANARKALEAAALSRASSGIPLMTDLQVGVPWEQILRSARKQDVSLIVIGSRGLRGLPRALMGSTAERVVRYARVPVLTLHEPVPSSSDDQVAGAKAADDLVDRWLI